MAPGGASGYWECTVIIENFLFEKRRSLKMKSAVETTTNTTKSNSTPLILRGDLSVLEWSILRFSKFLCRFPSIVKKDQPVYTRGYPDMCNEYIIFTDVSILKLVFVGCREHNGFPGYSSTGGCRQKPVL
jgi:hypothetical protein